MQNKISFRFIFKDQRDNAVKQPLLKYYFDMCTDTIEYENLENTDNLYFSEFHICSYKNTSKNGFNE